MPVTASPTPTVAPIPGDGVSPPYPNPVVEGETHADVLLSGRGGLTWRIQTTAFRVIAEGSIQSSGPTRASWDARDRNGSPVANGVYYWVFDFEGRRVVRKVIVLR
jgi:hypothetical protein